MRRFGISFAVFCVLQSLISPAFATKVDQFAAFINDEVILESEIDLERVFAGSCLAAAPERASELTRLELLNQVIDRKLLLHEARRFNPQKVTDDMIDARIALIEEKAGGKKIWDAFLKQAYLSRNEWRDKILEILTIEMYVDQWIKVFIKVQPAQIDAYIRNHIDQFELPDGNNKEEMLIADVEVRKLAANLIRQQAITNKMAEKVIELREKADISMIVPDEDVRDAPRGSGIKPNN